MNYQELMWEISQCKENLKRTDYKAIKFAEGVISESEFAPFRTQRAEWREQINQYEALLPEAKAEWDNRFIDNDDYDLPFVEREEDDNGMV